LELVYRSQIASIDKGGFNHTLAIVIRGGTCSFHVTLTLMVAAAGLITGNQVKKLGMSE
jgi:hypothetical protein